jgi:3-deoxy-D-manno-oct-2-ulosonic acid (Kdo) hydroxylase
MEILEHVPIQDWAGPFSAEISRKAVTSLEGGKILLAPTLRFDVLSTEERFLSSKYLSGKSKNISFNLNSQVLGGTECEDPDRRGLAAMMLRFAEHAVLLLRALCPMYAQELTPGLASFRPAEISGRASSWPRILRLFANVNRVRISGVASRPAV